MKQVSVFVLMLLITVMAAKALTITETEFDDGCSQCNVSDDDTKSLTLAINATINHANLSIKGNKGIGGIGGFQLNTEAQPYGITLIPGTNEFYVTDSTDTIYRIDSSGNFISNVSINSSCNDFWAVPYLPHKYKGIHAVNDEIIYVIHRDTLDTRNTMFQINYSLGNNDGCLDWWVFSNNIEVDDAAGVYVDDLEDMAYVTTDNFVLDDEIYAINISQCANLDCISYPNNWSMTQYNVTVDYDSITSIDNGTTFYAVRQFSSQSRLDVLNASFDITEQHSLVKTSAVDSYDTRNPVGITFNGTSLWFIDTYDTDEVVSASLTTPNNVLIKVNSSVVFNATGSFTTSNTTNLNLNNYLQDCYNTSESCNIDISASSYGLVEITGLSVSYNITNSALLSFASPSQISTSVVSGNSYTAEVNITNTGDYNASGFNFITVSQSGTPNLNDSISFSCSETNLINGSSMVCNVTFSNLILEPENDEKLKLESIGTDTGGNVFSNSIDVDISISAASGSGGGGGGESPQCEWKIFRPANRKISALGSFGYKTNLLSYQIYNNGSNTVSLSNQFQGLNCDIANKVIAVAGDSFASNTFTCEFPVEKDIGILLLSGQGCTQSIDVELTSNKLGLFFLFITGNAGLVNALIVWAALLTFGGFIVAGVTRG